MPEPNDRIPTLVEYTTNFAKAIGFGEHRGGVIQIPDFITFLKFSHEPAL